MGTARLTLIMECRQRESKCFTPSGFAQYIESVGTLKASGGDLGGGSENLIVEKQTNC